jgi:hypothetical protein
VLAYPERGGGSQLSYLFGAKSRHQITGAAMTEEIKDRSLTAADISDVVIEIVSGVAVMYGALCHRLDILGVMSAEQFQEDLVQKMPRELLQKALGSHPEGDARLAIQVVDALTASLDLKRPPKPIKGWQPTIIEGGRSS